jgi:hypothetical protein
MKLTDLSDNIFRNLGEPDSLSIPRIAFWLVGRIGELNVLLNTKIVYDETLQEFSPELTNEQASIFGLMYSVSFFTRLINVNLGAGAFDWSEISDGDTTIRRVSRNEISKTYTQVRNQLQVEFSDLVFYYKNNQVVPYSLSSVSDLLRFYRVERV